METARQWVAGWPREASAASSPPVPAHSRALQGPAPACEATATAGGARIDVLPWLVRERHSAGAGPRAPSIAIHGPRLAAAGADLQVIVGSPIGGALSLSRPTGWPNGIIATAPAGPLLPLRAARSSSTAQHAISNAPSRPTVAARPSGFIRIKLCMAAWPLRTVIRDPEHAKMEAEGDGDRPLSERERKLVERLVRLEEVRS